VAIHPDANQVILAWSVADSPAQWLPKLDTLAMDCLSSDSSDASARRWLRLSPRYLGRMTQGLRLLRCEGNAAARFQKQVQEQVERGEIGVPVEIQAMSGDRLQINNFTPRTR
jgi:hypothetical protein